MQNLPSILDTYFEASNAQDVDLYTSCFNEDAQIRDQDEIIQGRQNIATWIQEINGKYDSTTTIINWLEINGRIDVTTKVSGTFPGSPVELTFSFKLEENKIKELEID